jgi:hypothetical protein
MSGSRKTADQTNSTGAFKAPETLSGALEQFAKLKLFFEGGDDLEEFLCKFDLHANSYGWSPKERYVCFTLALRGEAYNVVADVPEGTEPDTAHQMLLRALRDRFGRSASDNLHTLATLKLEDCDGAAKYTHLMQVACKQLFPHQ